MAVKCIYSICKKKTLSQVKKKFTKKIRNTCVEIMISPRY